MELGAYGHVEVAIPVKIRHTGARGLRVFHWIKHRLRKGSVIGAGVEEHRHVIQHIIPRSEVVRAVAVEVAGRQRVKLHRLTADRDLALRETSGAVTEQNTDAAPSRASQMVHHREIGEGVAIEVPLHHVDGAVTDRDDRTGGQRAVPGVVVDAHLVAAVAGDHHIQPPVAVHIHQLDVPGIRAAGVIHRSAESSIRVAGQH